MLLFRPSALVLPATLRTNFFFETWLFAKNVLKNFSTFCFASPEIIGIEFGNRQIDGLQLYKTCNHQIPTPDWINIKVNNTQTTRQTSFLTSKMNRFKLGMNITVAQMAERVAHDLKVMGSNPAWFIMRLFF